jgi:cytochrome c peroxidase
MSMKSSFYRFAKLRGPFVLALALVGSPMDAGAGNMKSLKTEPVPLPANLDSFVADRAAAIRLGKALFWEQQTGGTGKQACASCHFQAGADVRVKNTINPGPDKVFNTVPVNGTLASRNFPIDNGDIAGSQGLIKMNFTKLNGAIDKCATVADPVFNVHGKNVRQVTGRNTPTNINAIFFFRNFWDGRANNIFNGVNPAGPNDPNATVLMVGPGGPAPIGVSIPDASLASQAVGPPNNGVEMSCAGRNFRQLGRKLLALRPLGTQVVSKTDSVLGALSRGAKKGLNTTYPDMIEAAFRSEWWNSSAIVDGFTVKESNFSLYWGLSIMLYESTLVSDDTRFDRFLDGNTAALTAEEQLGMDIFDGKGRCTHCHNGAVLSEATVANVAAALGDPLTGFFNVGVRPNVEDEGDILQGNGNFKTPALRNVELNGPYFHNGDKGTLRQLVDFYDRGGDFPDEFTDGQIRSLGLTEAEKHALVAFLVSLTDDRVRFERAPFDHPALSVPNGPSLKEVGAAGRSAVKPFLGLSPFQP